MKNVMATEYNFQKEMEQLNRQYKEREELLIKLISENCNVDME